MATQGTRHVELFSRLEGWRYLIVASELNHLTGEVQAVEPGFQPVRTMAYTSNGWRRILNWISYAITAFWVGVRQPRIDVVYGSSPHLLAALAAWAIAAVRRVPFVLEVRDLWPRVLVDMGQLSETSLVYRMLTRLEMFLYARARRIVVMAEGARTDLVRRGVPAEKIAYIPNGADPEDFVPSASREILREKYGFDKFTAIYTGAHGPANGLDLLLDAAHEVRDLPLDIVLVGGGVAKPALQQDARASWPHQRTVPRSGPQGGDPRSSACRGLGLARARRRRALPRCGESEQGVRLHGCRASGADQLSRHCG